MHRTFQHYYHCYNTISKVKNLKIYLVLHFLIVRVNYNRFGKRNFTGNLWFPNTFCEYKFALEKNENRTRMQIAHIFLFIILVFNTGNRDCGVRADDKTLNRLLNNQAIVSRQIMCVLEKSPCDQLGRQLKSESMTKYHLKYIDQFKAVTIGCIL